MSTNKKDIVIDEAHYTPVEPTEPILPLNELAKKLGKKDNERWNTSKVVQDKETGEKILVISGYQLKEKDRSKRMVKKGGEFDSENIVSGTRKRRTVNYKNCQDSKKKKSSSKNTLENRSKGTEKKSASKKRKTSSKKKEEELIEQQEEDEKENIENEMIEEEEQEIIQVQKKARRRRSAVVQKEKVEETPAVVEWTLPLSQLNCELIQKLGGVLPTESKRRMYKGQIIPEAVNYWCGVTWPKGVVFALDKSLTNDEPVGLIEHSLYELNEADADNIQWVKENPDAIMLADGEGILSCKPCDGKDSDFTVYIVLEATSEAEECIFKVKLSEYLAALSVDPREA